MNRDLARKHIKELIDKAGGLTAFAKSINRRPGNVGDWINPKKNSFPNYQGLKTICDLYNVTEAWLIGDTENKKELETSARILDLQEPKPTYATDNKLDRILNLLEKGYAIQEENLKQSKELQTALLNSQAMQQQQQQSINNLSQAIFNLTNKAQDNTDKDTSSADGSSNIKESHSALHQRPSMAGL